MISHNFENSYYEHRQDRTIFRLRQMRTVVPSKMALCWDQDQNTGMASLGLELYCLYVESQVDLCDTIDSEFQASAERPAELYQKLCYQNPQKRNGLQKTKTKKK